MKKYSDNKDIQLESHLDDAWERYADEDAIAAVPADRLSRIKARIDRVIDRMESPLQLRASLKRWRVWGSVAAAVIVMLLVSTVWLATRPTMLYSSDSFASKVVTAKGERATVVLPDGSEVTLNQCSTLSYQSSIATDSVRVVDLSGEAYFKVEHADHQQFSVNTGELAVIVTGTEFNVNAYNDNPAITVSLDKGSVSLVCDDNGDAVKMRCGEIAMYDRATGSIDIKSTGSYTGSAWVRHQITYYGVSPDSLINFIENQYTIKLTPEVHAAINDRFTGSLPDDNLSETLTILGKIYHFNPARAVGGL